MTTVSLMDVAGHLPGEPVPAAFYTEYPGAEDKLRDNPMFRVPRCGTTWPVRATRTWWSARCSRSSSATAATRSAPWTCC